MRLSDLTQYAEQLGATVTVYTWDGGRRIRVTHPAGVFYAGYEWGEEEPFCRRLQSFLSGLPWPREEDPRVQHEGVYA